MNYIEAIGLARLMESSGISIEDVLNNPAIPNKFRDQIKKTLEEEKIIEFQPARMIKSNEKHIDWLKGEDREKWYYWTELRKYLLTTRNWPIGSVQSLDKETDRILGQLASPKSKTAFYKRGLVLGFVQSGKTANYTALISKAVDSGYKLIIVLAGIDNGLRLQTHRRLKKELVGGQRGGVPLPPIGKQWFEFTQEKLDGDFRPGYVNTTALQTSQPVLLVIKKNGAVLRRLINWLNSASEEVMKTIPLLVIDDEADLASVDTRGSYQTKDEPLPDNYEKPSVINRLIRDLLGRFERKAYIAYTATPFANILIPHDTHDPIVKNDLYPHDFIVDLPKPHNYFGAEELFGRMDDVSEEPPRGIDVIRIISEEDLDILKECQLSPVIERAILSFVLSGAARSKRNPSDFPATMLVHVSFRIDDQLQIRDVVDKHFTKIRDEWRYDRDRGIRDKLKKLWEEDFMPVTKQTHADKVLSFKKLEPHISSFFESIQIRTMNSATGDVLDYETEPHLKAIAIGGNKLSRGLTLEGLLVSVFVRKTAMYDTLMQMGRWFGFRAGYEDLTRIFTTVELEQWFSVLAQVEHTLREDIKVYEEQLLTPHEVGLKIEEHPAMYVTSPLKSRYAYSTTISQSYSGQKEQTFIFPLNDLQSLSKQAEHNLVEVKKFLTKLKSPELCKSGPVWSGVSAEKIIKFLDNFRIDKSVTNISIPLIISYIKKQKLEGELEDWIVAVCGRKSADKNLGEADWGLGNERIKRISRTRIGRTQSLGVITSPGDDMIGLSKEEISRANDIVKDESFTKNKAARMVRSPKRGLLLLYPISKNSRPMKSGSPRRPLYDDSNHPLAKDLIGIAISFPYSEHEQPKKSHLTGTIDPWRRVDD